MLFCHIAVEKAKRVSGSTVHGHVRHVDYAEATEPERRPGADGPANARMVIAR